MRRCRRTSISRLRAVNKLISRELPIARGIVDLYSLTSRARATRGSSSREQLIVQMDDVGRQAAAERDRVPQSLKEEPRRIWVDETTGLGGVHAVRWRRRRKGPPVWQKTAQAFEEVVQMAVSSGSRERLALRLPSRDLP